MTWKPVKISDLDAKTQQEAQKNMDFWLGKGLLPTQPAQPDKAETVRQTTNKGRSAPSDGKNTRAKSKR